MGRRERRRVLDGGNDVRDAELGQLLRVFGGGKTGQVDARRDLAGRPFICGWRFAIGFHLGLLRGG